VAGRPPSSRGKTALALLVVGLAAFSPGCSLFVKATRNVCFEVNRDFDYLSSKIRYQSLATLAWEDLHRANPGQAVSEDYVCGFKEGYADFLESGGSGEPPTIPPPRYWSSRYQTPEGYRAIEDWFSGFRFGAGVAKESGYRQWVVIPTAGPPPHPADPQGPGDGSRPGWLSPSPTGVPPGAEPGLPPAAGDPELPYPKQVVPDKNGAKP
jgi:hypothetical protein